MKGSEFVLVGAVVIHDPEFLGAGVAVNESDLRSGDARNTAGEFGDDFVGELVSEFAHLCVGGIAAIDLAHDGFGRGTANIQAKMATSAEVSERFPKARKLALTGFWVQSSMRSSPGCEGALGG